MTYKAIRALRPKLRGAPTVTTHFMDVCRERMHPFLFKIYMNEASLRPALEEKAA